MREVFVGGVGMVRFGRYDGEKEWPSKEFYELGCEAVLGAFRDAEVEMHDIQAVFCGQVYQGTSAGFKVINEIGSTGIPIVNVENACSSSSSAFRLACQSIAAGIYDICLVIGVEKVPRGFVASTAWNEWERYMGFNVQPAAYALETVRHMKEYGVTEKQIAKVTVKNRKNGALFPFGFFQQGVTLEEVMNSRIIAKPLRLLMCCPNADGSVAAVLCSRDRLKSGKRAITVAASVLVSGMYGPLRGGGSVKIQNPNRTQMAARQAYEVAGCGPEDLDVAEVYDAMAPIELISLEDLGICKPGEAAHLLDEGIFDLGGKMPINTSGGLMSRGHPLGATGLAQIAEIVWQLRGEGGKRQVANAKAGLSHSMGAGQTCCVTILKR